MSEENKNVEENAGGAASGGTDAKTVSIISYLWVIGFIIGLVMHNNNKSELSAFHLRQMLGLLIIWLSTFVIGMIPIIGWFASVVIGLGSLVLWIMGFIGAMNGEKKPVPVLGEQFQEWFKGVF